MAVLRNELTGKREFLRPEHVIGRNLARADTFLAEPEVSLLHCLLRWSESGWQIQDISRNGTFVNERLLPKGEWVPLSVNQPIRFGSLLGTIWRLTDDTPPKTSLIPTLSSAPAIVLSNSNLLPHSDQPEVSIFQTEEGRWVLETLKESRIISDGEVLEIAGNQYQFQIIENIDNTQVIYSQESADSLLLRFTLSLDEEHTQLSLLHDQETADLGERQHHYSLVTLARKRFADAQTGFDPAEQGWLECNDLAQMLGIDPQYLNIQIFRARNQLMTQLPQFTQLANIIERRRGSLRFGAFAFEIRRGSNLEAHYFPLNAPCVNQESL